MTINLSRLLIEISGLVKKRNGKLRLTKTSQKIRQNDTDLLHHIILNFTTKFNWGYYHGFEDENIGQLSWVFSLSLLSKYGDTKPLDSFYAEKYFRAFPGLINELKPGRRSQEESAFRCYSLRLFNRFLDYFGLIEISEIKENEERKKISSQNRFI